MSAGRGGDRSGEGQTLYRRVAEELEALALEGPLGEETMFPTEWELVERLGVSRGTVRRALSDLEQSGLLWREAGRGTFVNPAARLRLVMWQRLLSVARPDSRFGFDFSSFIPDYEGSPQCTEAIRQLPEYRGSRTLVVTPDNNLESLRRAALEDGKRMLVCTYAMRRGLVVLDGRRIGARDRALAATLDGMERFGDALSFDELCAVGPIELVITGAAAVSREGVHFGKGHGYFDIEWGLLRELGLVEQHTPAVASVHDCQVVDDRVPHAAYDAVVDVIVTPTQVVRCPALDKPPGIFWDRLPWGFADDRPYFADARRLRSTRGRRGVARSATA